MRKLLFDKDQLDAIREIWSEADEICVDDEVEDIAVFGRVLHLNPQVFELPVEQFLALVVEHGQYIIDENR